MSTLYGPEPTAPSEKAEYWRKRKEKAVADMAKLSTAILAGFENRHPEWKGRSWPEDFAGENGQYECICLHCKSHFLGYKRRMVCKVCATPAPAPEAK
jgi:hypothetical protein